MQLAAFIILFIVLCIFVIRGFSLCKRKMIREWLTKFTYISETNSYMEARQRSFAGKGYGKIPHAVLLIHGYSTSPRDFEILYPKFEAADISYYAPVYTGFGVGDLRLLAAVKAEDWLRDVLNAYDCLATFAEKISVIGHSNGGTLAFLLAQHRQVNQLILVNPNLFIHPRARKAKKMVLNPIVGWFYNLLKPYYNKPILPGNVTNLDYADQERAPTTFHFGVLPTTSFQAICKLQDSIDYKSKVNCKKISVLYGTRDRSVSNPDAFAVLKANDIPFAAYAYENSAHQLLNDFDREPAANQIIKILQEN